MISKRNSNLHVSYCHKIAKCILLLLSINDGLTLMIQGSDKKFRKVNIGFTFYRWTQKQLHINANIAVIFLTKSLNKPLFAVLFI